MQKKRAYLAISFSDKHLLNTEIAYLVEKVKAVGIDVFVFVNHYNFKNNQEREMMKTAFKEINKSDYLLAELTKKSIGVGIEVGYAFAQKKPIIYFRKKGSEYSTTAAGTADFSIEYANKKELVDKVVEAILQVNKTLKTQK